MLQDLRDRLAADKELCTHGRTTVVMPNSSNIVSSFEETHAKTELAKFVQVVDASKAGADDQNVVGLYFFSHCVLVTSAGNVKSIRLSSLVQPKCTELLLVA